jgi:hypothetical protein
MLNSDINCSVKPIAKCCIVAYADRLTSDCAGAIVSLHGITLH